MLVDKNKKLNVILNKNLLFLIAFFVFILFSNNLYALDDDCADDMCVVDPNEFNLLDQNISNNNDDNIGNNSDIGNNDELDLTCFVYFTGIGCPHCAKIDPVIFNDILPNNENIVIIEYEVKNKAENAQYMVYYNNIYNSGYDIPVMIYKPENTYFYKEILDKTNSLDLERNICPLPDVIYSGQTDYFENINVNELQGKPTIWKDNRALEKTCDCDLEHQFVSNLLLKDISEVDSLLQDINYTFLEDTSINYSAGSRTFDNAVQLDGWKFYWDGDTNLVNKDTLFVSNKNNSECDENTKISFLKVSFLALADSVNPCALAVLLLMLMSIVIANPNNKKVILKSGLSFILAVLVMYFIYGLLLIRLFAFLDPFRFVVYKAVAIVAIVLGILEIKDYFNYKPGTIGTEMPMSLRPKMKRFVSKITSPIGAFFMGLFVTVFLLPCTIGPYVILGSMLSLKGIISSIPLLFWYNLLFVLPMLIVVLLIYFGMSQIKDVQTWKEKNIKYLHLVAGIIIIIIGILMFFGII